MIKQFSILAFVLMSLTAFTQAPVANSDGTHFSIDGQVASATYNGDKYEVYISVSPKQATILVANQIKAKKNSKFYLCGETYEVLYTSSKYVFNEITYKNSKECRKAVRNFARMKLGIISQDEYAETQNKNSED